MNLSINSENSSTNQNSDNSQDNSGDQQIKNYVQNFQLEVERKYKASPVNQNYIFPKFNKIKNVSPKISFESLKDIQTYDLKGQNISQLIQSERKALKSQSDVLFTLIKKISNLDSDFVKQQFANKNSSLFKNLSNLVLDMQPPKRKKNKKVKNKYSVRDANFPNMHVKNKTARVNSPIQNSQPTERLMNFKKCRSNDSLTRLNLKKILGYQKNTTKDSKRKIKVQNSLNRKKINNMSIQNKNQKDKKFKKNVQSFIKNKNSLQKSKPKKNFQSIVQKKNSYMNQRIKQKHQFKSSRQLKPFTPISQNTMMYMVREKFLNQKQKKMTKKKSFNKTQIQEIIKITKTPLSSYRSKKAFSKQKKINY